MVCHDSTPPSHTDGCRGGGRGRGGRRRGGGGGGRGGGRGDEGRGVLKLTSEQKSIAAGIVPPNFGLHHKSSEDGGVAIVCAVCVDDLSSDQESSSSSSSSKRKRGKDSVYKCPRCLTPYCSVICYRRHHRESCGTINSNEQPWNAPNGQFVHAASLKNGTPMTPYGVYDPKSGESVLTITEEEVRVNARKHYKKSQEDQEDPEIEEGWSLTTEQMRVLDRSEFVKTELGDKGLRAIIGRIVKGEAGKGKKIQDKGTRLRREMAYNEKFGSFLERMLLEIGVYEERADGRLVLKEVGRKANNKLVNECKALIEKDKEGKL